MTIPSWLPSLAATVIPALFVAVITAVVTVKLSLRRFYTERWWERKAEAYTRIIECLYHIKAYSDSKVPEYLEGAEYSPERKQKLSEEYAAAHRDLDKTTAIGSYIICDHAAQILDELKKRPGLSWENNPPWEIFEDDAKAYGEALNKLRAVAKKDLGVQ